ncbi:hypothetical protein DFJ77DRAFT_463197 [Powellomyces hirtus]|nr:hypothetical protein DFJ77DRAFT_463197 [Powellomyces hirtus]
MNQFPPFPPYATYQPAQELPASTGAPYRLVRDIRPGYRDINMRVIIIDKYVTEGHRPVTLFWLGDQSGSIVCTITGRAAFENHKKGDMLDITNCEARLQRGRMEIFFGKASRLIRYSEDLQAFIPQPNMSHYLWKNEAGGGWVRSDHGPRALQI